jgi:L1 cell adhesion molecule like protein
MTKADIHEIVLVGGSTRIPKVQQLIKDFFDGMEPIKSVNPDEAMACGAAVQAAVLHGDMSTRNIQDVLLLDCTALSLGISVCNGLMNVILKRNTPIPSKQRNEYTTPADNDTYLTIKVLLPKQ